MTSYLHYLRGGLVTCGAASSTTLILLFREEVLSRRFPFQPGSVTPAAGITDPGYSGTNEVERTNILAPGV